MSDTELADDMDCVEELCETTGLDIPDGWGGGNARHTGGGIWVREFVNEDETRHVTYSLSPNEPGVGVEEGSIDDSIGVWIPNDVIAEEPTPETDISKFKSAVGLMEEY